VRRDHPLQAGDHRSSIAGVERPFFFGLAVQAMLPMRHMIFFTAT